MTVDWYPVVNAARWITGAALVVAILIYYPTVGWLVLRIALAVLASSE